MTFLQVCSAPFQVIPNKFVMTIFFLTPFVMTNLWNQLLVSLSQATIILILKI